MTEKVNPSHPDKVADRIAGALVDLAYLKQENPRMAAEVLLGHGQALIIAETSVHIETKEVKQIVDRITDNQIRDLTFKLVAQDPRLAENQKNMMRCGDNGIFKGVPVTKEERALADFVRAAYLKFPTDGKFILHNRHLTICQSWAERNKIERWVRNEMDPAMADTFVINPLGFWTGGLEVDSGANQPQAGIRHGTGRDRRRTPRQGPEQGRRGNQHLVLHGGPAQGTARRAELQHWRREGRRNLLQRHRRAGPPFH